MIFLQGHELHVHRDYYKLADTTFDVTKMATVLEAMEHGKVNAGVTPNFDDFVKNYTQEVDSDISEDESDDDENGSGNPRFAKAIVKQLRKEFSKFIEAQKKPKVKDCEDFATRISNEYPDEDFSPQQIRDRVWVIIRQDQKKSKTAEKRAKKEEKKSQKKAPKRKMSDEDPKPSTSYAATSTKKSKKGNK